MGQVNGQCLCGAVKFTLSDQFDAFYQCHCKQCQQLTGSAFASNLFTSPNNIAWVAGQNNVTVYHHPTRTFSKAFCTTCGSAVPFITKSGKSLLVPAGTLDTDVSIKVQAQIFTTEQAPWVDPKQPMQHFEGFPK